jgi:hypothetical protein
VSEAEMPRRGTTQWQEGDTQFACSYMFLLVPSRGHVQN